MEHTKRWYEQPGPVLAILGASLLGLFVLSTAWRTFRYSLAFRSGAPIELPQFEKKFTSIGTKTAAVPGGAQNVLSDRAPTLGSPQAKVTIVEFGDYECPFSREVHPAIRAIATEYPGKVRYLWRDFPLETIHPHARAAAVAASCAERQGKFWQMHDKLFLNPDALERADFLRYAEALGLNTATFATCLDEGGDGERIASDLTAAADAGLRGTPTFFINGVRVEGAIPYDVLKKIVENLSS